MAYLQLSRNGFVYAIKRLDFSVLGNYGEGGTFTNKKPIK